VQLMQRLLYPIVEDIVRVWCEMKPHGVLQNHLLRSSAALIAQGIVVKYPEYKFAEELGNDIILGGIESLAVQLPILVQQHLLA
jgi:hypothetical protein